MFLSGPQTNRGDKSLAADDAATLQAAAAGAGSRTVIPLGGSPPRSVMIARLDVNDAALVLLGGPFTRSFGTDEEAWLHQYAAMVSTGRSACDWWRSWRRPTAKLEGKVRESHRADSAARIGEPRARGVFLHDLARPARAAAGGQRLYRHPVRGLRGCDCRPKHVVT